MIKDYELVKELNYLLEKRCQFLLGKLNEIRDILIDHKIRGAKITIDDIKRLLEMLD